MSGETVLKHCSPTLAGMKTGSLFACHFENKAELTDTMCLWNQMLVKKGLRMLPLKYENKRALIYVFRVSQLCRDLTDSTASRILSDRGYLSKEPEKCIIKLISRLKESEEFPHEIGLFLGYPPEDVCGFIENKADGCKCVGNWKVYGDEEKAKKLFAKYKKCTKVYCSQHANGKPVERLTVAG